MKILFVTALLHAVAATQDSCDMWRLESDMISPLDLAFHGVPPDEETFRMWCKDVKRREDTSGNYSLNCLSPLQREVIGLMNGSNEVGRQLCVRGSEVRARYFEHVDCLSDGAESDEFKATLVDLQLLIEKLSHVPYKHRFPLMCCGFRRFQKDSDAITARRCGEPAVEIAKSFRTTIITELPDTICQKFEPESEECQNLLTAPGAPSKNGDIHSGLAALIDKLFYNDLAFSSESLPSYLRRRLK